MGLYKLSDGTSSVDMDPTRGLNIPENRIRQLIETKAGKPDSYEYGAAEKYEIPLININKTKSDRLLSWWQNQDALTFTPDQASSAQTFQMIIDGIKRPMDMWHDRFKSKYAETLVLHEVSSQSFSSSQVSVSRSISCSSFNSSRSLGFSSSLSCSAFLADTSDSSSFGYDDSFSTSRSCSVSFSISLSRSCDYASVSGEGGYVTVSQCGNVSLTTSPSSCEDLSSKGSSLSLGIIPVPTFSQSCSFDATVSSLSTSAAGKSCSNSAGGIS